MMSRETTRIPVTEMENPRAQNLSSLTAVEIVRLMNQEDAEVARAIERITGDVAQAVNGIVARIQSGGRLFYIGAGTSGRLGILDAAECPPTFGVAPHLVQGIIAGGYEACYQAVEASEDDPEAGARDLTSHRVVNLDAVVGIAASGSTAYTVGALRYAQSLGALTVAVTCAPDSPITHVANVVIAPVVGPEVLAGSTRLKAGTAQKMVLNMLSTATLIGLGYTSGNRMSNLIARNSKLRARAARIISAETDLDEAAARAALEAGGGDLRIALVMVRTGCSRDEAVETLSMTHGQIQKAVEMLGQKH